MKIIAEIGSNWSSFSDIISSINCAAKYKCDYVKFQLFTYGALYGPIHNHEYEIENKKTNDWQLPPEWLPRMAKAASDAKVGFMCTGFSPLLYEQIDPFVDVHKIASAEMCHPGILSKVKSFKKPVLVSMGSHSPIEIEWMLKELQGVPVTVMYCVSAYPARTIDFRWIKFLKNKFGVDVGFSDHSLDTLNIPKIAMLEGASIIEKHVNFSDVESPDSPFSLSEREFKEMVDNLRGEYEFKPYYHFSENDMVQKHNRRIIALKDVQPGEILVENLNIGIYRSTKQDSKGLNPRHMKDLKGKHAKNLIQKSNGVGPDDIGV